MNTLLINAKILIVLTVISSILSGCGLTARYKQHPGGIAETLELNQLESDVFELKQAVVFTRYGVDPAPELLLKLTAHNEAHEICGSFRGIKRIQFEPVVKGLVKKNSIYQKKVTMQSLFECMEIDEQHEYGMRKNFVDNKTMEVIMMAYEVEFVEGFDIEKFLENEFDFHTIGFCKDIEFVESNEFDLTEGILEYSLPERHGYHVFRLVGTIVCSK